MSESTYAPPVSALLTLGDARQLTGWPDYLAYGLTAEDIPALSRLALDEDLYFSEGESAEVWAPIHAWRALGQLRTAEAIEPLMQVLHRSEEWDDDWSSEDVPEALGLIGSAAIAPVKTFLADPAHSMWVRGAVAGALEKIAEQYPDSRADCVTVLSDQLGQHEHQAPTLNAFLISSLVHLHAIEAAPAMEAAFATNQVDLSVQGDWEEVQIRLGLLTERLTSLPKGGWLPAFLTDPLRPPPPKPDPAVIAKKEQEEALRAKRRRTHKLAKATKQKQMHQKKKSKKKR